MKRSLLLVLTFAIIGIILISPVAAQTNQGLQWGCQVNDRFDFNFNYDDGVNSISDALYFEIVSASAIPDSISDWASIPDLGWGAYWSANDTALNIFELIIIFAGITTVGEKFAVPIGNWSLLHDLLAPVLPGESYIDNSAYWGVVWSEDVSPSEELRVTATYLKSDGFLAKYLVEVWDTVDNERSGFIEVIREGLPSDIIVLIQDNLLYIGVGVVVLLVLAIACRRR